MQAIVTKYFGPTNFRGNRVKATCAAGSLTIDCDDRLSVDGNFNVVAVALAEKLGWRNDHYGKMAVGGLPKGGNVYVFVNQDDLL